MKKVIIRIFIGIVLLYLCWLSFLSVQIPITKNIARIILFASIFLMVFNKIRKEESLSRRKEITIKILRKTTSIFILPILSFSYFFAFVSRPTKNILLSLFLVLFCLLVISRVKREKTAIKKVFTGILYSLILIFWCVFSSFPLGMIHMYTSSSHFCDFVYTAKIEAENGKFLDLSLGKIEKLTGGGFQDGGCDAIISYKDNSEYAVKAIKDMGGEISKNCDSGNCLFYKKDQAGAEIDTLLYDLTTHKLYYTYENN